MAFVQWISLVSECEKNLNLNLKLWFENLFGVKFSSLKLLLTHFPHHPKKKGSNLVEAEKGVFKVEVENEYLEVKF